MTRLRSGPNCASAGWPRRVGRREGQLDVGAVTLSYRCLRRLMCYYLPFGGVGLVVARRQPRNPVGWILLGFAVLLVVSNCAGA